MSRNRSFRELRRRAAIVSVFVLSVSVAFASQAPTASALKPSHSSAPETVPGEILVKLKSTAKSGKSAENALLGILTNAKNNFRASQISRIASVESEPRLQKIVAKNAKETQSMIDALNADPQVAYAEPNFIYRIVSADAPNDPRYGEQWGLVNSGQTDVSGRKGVKGVDVGVAPLWKRGYVGDKSMLVAVIDTGIDYKHPDLATNVVDGGKSYATPATADGMDDHGHGSHCAGVIGAVADNAEGVAGVNRDVSLIPVKFLSATGGGTSDGAVNAVNYAISRGVKIMSNSWGGGGYSKALEDAIKKARDNGILFIAAAGNDMNDNDGWKYYPANYDVDNVITVAAITNQATGASFTNYGRKEVDVAAPGVNILSTVVSTNPKGPYGNMSGTSMATPHVAGVAALLWAANPSWTYLDVKERLIKSSVPSRMLANKTVSGGYVSAVNAMDGVFPTPIAVPNEKDWVDVAYTVETPHPYKDDADDSYKITVPGAKHIRVVFDQFDTEKGYDVVRFTDAKGTAYSYHSGNYKGLKSDYVDGDTAIVRFTSDPAYVPPPPAKPMPNGFGFKITKVQVIK